MTDTMNLKAVNSVTARDGRVSAVCACCGKKSRPVRADQHGEPDLFEMPRNWSQAPYPADHQHEDGSIGSTYTCPTCNAQLSAGKTLTRRGYITAAVIAKAMDPMSATIRKVTPAQRLLNEEEALSKAGMTRDDVLRPFNEAVERARKRLIEDVLPVLAPLWEQILLAEAGDPNARKIVYRHKRLRRCLERERIVNPIILLSLEDALNAYRRSRGPDGRRADPSSGRALRARDPKK